MRGALAATEDPAYPAEVVVVGSDRPPTDWSTPAVAASRRSPALWPTIPTGPPGTAPWPPSCRLRAGLVVSAGFMKLVGPAVLDAFGGRLINTHPALLPAFPGAHAVRDALEAGASVTGATVHVVDATTPGRSSPSGGSRPARGRRGAAARADQGRGARAPGAHGGGDRHRIDEGEPR